MQSPSDTLRILLTTQILFLVNQAKERFGLGDLPSVSNENVLQKWPMPKVDPFTLKRMCRFITEHRQKKGVFPTLKDLNDQGFSKSKVDQAQRDGIILEIPVTMTNGSVVKGYKVVSRW